MSVQHRDLRLFYRDQQQFCRVALSRSLQPFQPEICVSQVLIFVPRAQLLLQRCSQQSFYPVLPFLWQGLILLTK